MEIKILCPCGAKFKFDVEPVNGLSPGPVQCPACGRDSTGATNTQIRERLGAPAPVATIVSAPAIPKISVSAPTPASAPAVRIPATPTSAPSPTPAPVHVSASAAPAQPAAGVGPKMTVMPVPQTSKPLSVKPPGEAAVHAAPPPSAPAPSNASGDPKAPGSPKMAFMPAPAAGSGSSLSVSGAQPAAAPAAGHASPPPPPPPSHPAASKMVRSEPAKSAGSFGKGVAGAIIGCLVGAGIWYFLTLNVIEGWAILAWIPGIVGGYCAVLMGRQRSQQLGVAAAIVAAVVTLGMQFVVISAINDKHLTEASEAHFKENMAFAKKAAEAKTDAQVKELIQEDPQNNGYEVRSFREAFQKIAKMAEKAEKEEAAKSAGGAAATTPDEAEEIAKYRSKRLPELIKFSKGEPSRTRFLEQERARLTEEGEILYNKSWIWMGIWIASSVEAAFLLGRGKKKE